MSTIGRNYSNEPAGPKFLRRCSTCPPDEDSTIDLGTEQGRLAKESESGYMCVNCQQRQIERITPVSDQSLSRKISEKWGRPGRTRVKGEQIYFWVGVQRSIGGRGK
jgi:hypothetical protein